MNSILKKRFREIIRKHYEDNYTRSFERTKEMYTTIALIDQILDEVTVDDLIPQKRIEQIKILSNLIDGIYDNPDILKTEYQFPLVLPKGEQVKMIVTFKENK